MQKKIVFINIFLLFIAFTFFSFKSKATESTYSEKYIVKDLEIKAKSNSSNEAKEEALKNGQRVALKILFGNLGLNRAYTKYINNSTISDMISSIRISEEIITKDSYSSKVTILFDPEFTDYNLNNLKIKSGKTTPEVILYIPLYDSGDKNISIIDSSNLWYKTVYDKFFEDEMENIFVIDNYSLSNSGLLSKRKIEQKKYESFNTLLKKYASNIIVISIAKYNKELDRIEIILTEIDAENEKKRVLNYINRNNLTKDDLIKEASAKTFDFIVNLYNQPKEEKTSSKEIKKKDYIDILISIKNLKDYVYLKNLIKNLNFIKNYETLNITTKIAKIRIHYNCDEAELIQLFRNKNFILDNKKDQYFLNYVEN